MQYSDHKWALEAWEAQVDLAFIGHCAKFYVVQQMKEKAYSSNTQTTNSTVQVHSDVQPVAQDSAWDTLKYVAVKTDV